MTGLAPLAIAVPILVACVLFAGGRLLPRAAIDAVAITGSATVLALDVLLLVAASGGRVVTWVGGWRPTKGVTFGIVLVADPIGIGLAAVAAVLVTAALVFSTRYYQAEEGHLHALLLLFLTGMTGFTLTGDLFDMLVFFELMGAVAYALTAFVVEDRSAVHGAVNFGIVNSLGAYLTLFGVALLYGQTGRLGLAQLAEALSGKPPNALVAVAFVMICTGWLVKAAVVPFHFWTADAEAVAPSPVCAILSGAMVQLGLYGVARLYWTVFVGPLGPGHVRPALFLLGAAGCIIGSTMCLLQRNLKRLLAYSTIAHVGLILVVVGALRTDALAGAAVYVVAQAGAKGALFLIAGVVLNRLGSVDEVALHGRGSAREPVGWAMVAGGLALAALPPFGTALGKAMADDAVPHTGAGWAPVLFVLVSAATGGAVLRSAGRIFFGLGPAERGEHGGGKQMTGSTTRETGTNLRRLPVTMLAPVLVLLAGSLAVGILPGVPAAATDAAARFTDADGYVRQALALPGSVVGPVPLVHGWTLPGVLLGLVSAAAAVGIAGVALFVPYVAPARMPAPARKVLDGLRTLHSGHVGDYVAWLLVGVAALLALVALPVLA